MACENLRIVLDGNEKCFSNTNNAREMGKRFSLRNPQQKEICRVHIDDCLITDKTIKKCDFLFGIDNSRYYLIELKGVDINTAIEQIVNTYEIVNSKIKAPVSNYKGIVISSEVPSQAHQKFRNLAEKLYRDKKLMITRSQNQHEELI